MNTMTRFIPAVLLAVGGVVLASKPAAVAMPLRSELSVIPNVIDGQPGKDLTISAEEVRVAGTTSYLMRTYGDEKRPLFSLYIGYHAAQTQANQMHSPRNCMPGAGWQVLTTGVTKVNGVDVNRNLLEFKGTKALVLYWYQGRGRVTADEFDVKMHLFRDAAATGRTEEALVRIVIPVISKADEQRDGRALTPAEADALGVRIAAQVIPRLHEILPQKPDVKSKSTVALQ